MAFSRKAAHVQASKLVRAGKRDEATKIFRAILSKNPEDKRAKRGLAALAGNSMQKMIAHFRAGRLRELLREADKARAIDALPPEGENLAGVVSQNLGDEAYALGAFQRAVKANPEYPEAHSNLAQALLKGGNLDDAQRAADRALELSPFMHEPHNTLGMLLNLSGDGDGAAERFRNALKIRPDFFEAQFNLGNTLRDLGRPSEAIAAYKAAIAMRNGVAEVWLNLGAVYQSSGQDLKALDAYRSAVKIAPSDPEALSNCGTVLRALGQLEESLDVLRMARDVAPDSASINYNLGCTLDDMQRYNEAIECLKTAQSLDPGHGAARSQLLHLYALVCDWEALELALSHPALPGAGTEPPFTWLSLSDDPLSQRNRAENYSLALFPRVAPMIAARARQTNDPLRVGYLSCDFRDHPVGRIVARLLEVHDRSRVKVFGYSFGPNTVDGVRTRIEDACDSFRDLRAESDLSIANKIREDGVDLLVDLSGYTEGCRPGILAERAAPVQISFLGYPGTMGAGFIDYIVADKTLIPPDKTEGYSESPIWLPYCYQPQDDQRVAVSNVLDRASLGLPPSGFVLACFNNSFKIRAPEFSIWMRLLQHQPEAVLWLYGSNPWSVENLKKRAELAGVDPARLIFGQRTSYEEYLSRLSHADLFLDTYLYNAGATASDALWAGLPVLTKAGNGYVTRMATSLLTAADLSELVAQTEREYEEKALQLLTEPNTLETIKNRLLDAKRNAPLFDIMHYSRALERGFFLAHSNSCEGKRPEPIDLSGMGKPL